MKKISKRPHPGSEQIKMDVLSRRLIAFSSYLYQIGYYKLKSECQVMPLRGIRGEGAATDDFRCSV